MKVSFKRNLGIEKDAEAIIENGMNTYEKG